MAEVHFELTDDEIADFVSRTENAANYANSPYVISRSEMVSMYRKLFPLIIHKLFGKYITEINQTSFLIRYNVSTLTVSTLT